MWNQHMQAKRKADNEKKKNIDQNYLNFKNKAVNCDYMKLEKSRNINSQV